MRGINHQQIDLLGDQRLAALEGVRPDADRRADTQAALAVFRRVGKLDAFLDVLDGDQPTQHAMLVHKRQLLDLVARQDLARLLQRDAHRRGDQALAGHDLGDGTFIVGLEAHVAVGQDADEPPASR